MAVNLLMKFNGIGQQLDIFKDVAAFQNQFLFPRIIHNFSLHVFLCKYCEITEIYPPKSVD